MKNKKLINVLAYFILKMLFIILYYCIGYQNIYGSDISVWPDAIKFNFESGNSNDAITLREYYQSQPPIAAPEWTSTGTNERIAYICNQSNRKIQVSFNSNCEYMHLIINLTVISGTGIGTLCNYFISNYNKLSYITLALEGTIPSTIDIRQFTWQWSIYAIPINPGYCAETSITNTTHTYFTLLSTPLYPHEIPAVQILNYACDWAAGNNNAAGVCSDLLENGFAVYYQWSGNCYALASTFVHFMTALGISGTSMHKWSSITDSPTIGDMILQKTNEIDPVGDANDTHEYYFTFHQWAEFNSNQIDPTTASTFNGSWGDYEDDIYMLYHEAAPVAGGFIERYNQPGQSQYCEDVGNRIYINNPPLSVFIDPFH